MTTIIVFIVSFFGLTTLLVAKTLENRSGKRSVLLKIFSTLDDKAENLINKISSLIVKTFQSIKYTFKVLLAQFLREFYEKLKYDIEREYQARQEIFLGRKDISNRGSVSFFLKKISEDRSGARRGRIE